MVLKKYSDCIAVVVTRLLIRRSLVRAQVEEPNTKTTFLGGFSFPNCDGLIDKA